MNTIVCVKLVPEVADAELVLLEDGSDIEREDLVLDINEWDSFAVEEAVRLKEAHGGEVTAVTLGDDDAEDVLRRALAMGADRAVRIDAAAFAGTDAMGIARGLAAAIRGRPFDLVLAGAQAADDGWAAVGPMLAQLLALPYATLVVGIEVAGGKVRVERELESSCREKVELDLPALLTVQTGINQPRYVSVMGIRKARAIAIEQSAAGALGLGEGGPRASCVAGRRLFLPEKGKGAQMLSGSMEAICGRAAEIIRERVGGVK
ncbi:MAG: electron transfer flavoprotein subunit beta/FixA family protein [Deltaproteobacteria bacterium]|nr:electron transfer flavoprotein subunit beta/FixA family protein [Deltaproteobacteria bacterium]